MSAAWLIEALIASALLMAFVLLVRKAAQRALGAQLAYWLWALPALRMATPPLPAAWREHVAAPVAAAGETVLVYIAPAASTDPAVAPFPWLAFVAAAWCVGALGFFAWHGAAHFSYVRRIISPPARHERMSDGTTLVESEEAIGPVAFGVLRRFVAVPRDFADRYDEDERRLALAHELGHHARGDLIANWIALALLAVHWFNPLAWIAYRKFRTDQELANDARVLASLRPVERHAYACAILKAANGRAVTAACHLHTIEDLKGRLRMLKATRKSRAVLLTGATGIAALTVAGLGLTASAVAAEKLRSVATVEAPRLVAQMAPIAPMMAQAAPLSPTAPATPATPPRVKKIVLVKDGETKTYEGEKADAFLADHPEFAASGGRRVVRTQTLRITGKDGVTRVYEGDAAKAYLKEHPELRRPLPPLPPVVGMAPLPPLPPMDGTRVIMRSRDGDVRSVTSDVFSRDRGTRPQRFRVESKSGVGGPFTIVVPSTPQITQRNCGPGTSSIDKVKRDGRETFVICADRIRVAAEQGAAVAAQSAQVERRALASALLGLRRARANVTANVPADSRAEALAAIDQSIAELESQAIRQ